MGAGGAEPIAGAKTPDRVNRFQKHRKKTVAAIALATFVAFDLAAGTIASDARRRALERFAAGEHRYRIASPDYHHGLRPRTSVDDARWGPVTYKVRTDSLGFRDRSVRSVPLASDRRRIVFIGDSFTEGTGVDYEKTFPALVEDALVARDPRFEVLDAAAASYFPGIYYVKIRHLLERGLAMSEVVVCIDISDADDEATEVYPPAAAIASTNSSAPPLAATSAATPEAAHMQGALRPGGLAVFLAEHTLVTYGALKAVKDALSPPLPPGVISERGLWTIKQETYDTFGALGNERCVAHMDLLAALLEERGIPLTVVVYPWPAQIYFHDLDSKQVRLWREWSARKGARFVNVFPAFVMDAPPLETIRRYYIDGDIHWNEEGHKVVARTILDAHLWE